MSDQQTLSLTNVISVSVQGTPSNLGIPNINTAALFSRETPNGWDNGQTFKIYTDPSTVAVDFGSSSNASKIASGFFAQQPNPLNTGGYLAIIPLLSTPGPETVKAAIIRTINSVYYFGVLVDEIIDDTVLGLLAAYMQSIDKMLFYADDDKTDFAPGGPLDLFRSSSETHCRGLYYNDSTAIDTQVMAAAYCARALSSDFQGNNTTQTMHLKVLAGITPDQTVDQTALEAAQTAGVDVYVSVAGVPCCFTSGANSFFDEIYNEFWIKFALQTAGFNYLRATSTKIPQTESGIEGLKNEYRKVCDQARNNGFIGPGTWTSPQVFGDPAALVRSVGDIGYYVWALPLSKQLQANREARIAPLIQIAIKAQGAVHKSNVIVNVNL